jgi:pyruvate formate-lyase activating enzyme-like uncharacterized protein
MIIEEGSVFNITDECFDVKKPIKPTASIDRTMMSASLASWPTNSQLLKLDSMNVDPRLSTPMLLNQSFCSSQASDSLEANNNTHASKAASRRRHRKDKKQQGIYQIEIVFDRPTKYLAIPMEVFKIAMKETTMDMNKEITRQLNIISTSIVERITSMLPWICEKKELWLQV